jgi:hypothetical protein
LESFLENARFLETEIINFFIKKKGGKMKRFWLVLLSLSLVMAFTVSAYAVDVKVGADYYVGGLYLNKTAVWDNLTYLDGFYNPSGHFVPGRSYYYLTPQQPSTAFFYQDLRVGIDFIVSPCLKLVTQFDAMERIWGGARSDVDVPDARGAGTRAEAENISMRQIHVDYTSPIGLFKVGYMEDFVFGTVFADRASGPTSGQIQYFIEKGPFTGFIGYAKEVDNSASAVTSSAVTDNDLDSYRIAGIYKFKGGEAGALFLWNRDATNKPLSTTDGPFLSNVYVIDPYVKAKIGPVALQAEAQYWFGDAYKWENGITESNVSVNALSLFVDATADFGMFYAGGSFAYLSGQNPNKTDTVTGGINTGGLDWNPCLILFNQDLNYWAGSVYGFDGSALNGEMSNAWFGQLRAGVKPTPQLDVMLAVSYAAADQKPNITYLSVHPSVPTYTRSFTGSTYGTEIDLTGTYKITKNLSYMLGIGYLFTGDYFKGTENGKIGHFPDQTGLPNKIDDDFIIMNKLTLSF